MRAINTGHSIAAGNLRPPSFRSSITNGTSRSRDAVLRPNTTSNFGMMSADRTRTRRERTFVGSECAVCEEPLEHTLRGERILQFSCSHVSHEACFYEFIREFESQYCPYAMRRCILTLVAVGMYWILVCLKFLHQRA